jgi:VWFA-related protein
MMALAVPVSVPITTVAAPQAGSEPDLPRVSDLFERTEVRVLLVDVFAADRDGNPIRDLRRDEFLLFIDGEPAVIDSLDIRELEVREAAAPPETVVIPGEEEVVPVPRSGQKVVLLFDAWNSSMASQQRIRERAVAFLEDDSFPFDEAMVLSLGDRLRMVQGMTSDRGTLLAAVRGLAADESDLEIYWNQVGSRIAEIEGARSGGCAAVWNMVHAFAEEERYRSVRTIQILKGVVYSLGALPGRKSIIYLTEGLQQYAGGAYFHAAMSLGCGGKTGEVNPVEMQMVTDFGELYEDANAANVTFHTVDARIATVGSQPFLTSLAHQTGGVRSTASVSVEKGFETIARQMASYYTLGHTLAAVEPDGQVHSIKVEVSRPGVTLRYRLQFADLGWRQKAERSVIGAFVMPELHTEIPIETRILPFRKKKENYDVYFEIGLPVGEMSWVPFHLSELGEIEFAGVITSKTGRSKYEFRDIMNLSRDPTAGPPGPGAGTFYRGHTELGPGYYELVAAVHDVGGGRIGATRRGFEIPELNDNEFSLGGLVLAKYSRGDFVVGAYSPYPKKKRFPRKYRRENFVPIMGDELGTEDVLLTYLQIYDPRRRKKKETPPLTVRISFLRDGELIGTHKPVRLDEDDEDAEENDSSLPFAMLTPLVDFDPGDYELRVEVREKGTNRSLVREVPLQIRDVAKTAGDGSERDPQGFSTLPETLPMSIPPDPPE